MKVLVLHGINLNMFGRRDPAHYGTWTLTDINNALKNLADELKVKIHIYQTNHEGAMIERIHQALDENLSAVVINAGAWTHYSYGIADALAMLCMPVVEAHMSRVFAREEFRRQSVLAPVASGTIAGFGAESYLLALRAAVYLAKTSQPKAAV